MYESFYELKEKPFSLTPDPKFIYWSNKHREALASLLYAVRERRGFMVLTGEVGTGKTTLIRKLLGSLGDDTVTAFIFNPPRTVGELFAYMFEEFGLSLNGKTKGELVIQLSRFLIDRILKGQNTLLVIDEAQNLGPRMLEEIRLLSNLETNQEKLIQIILVGQPELAAMLKLPELRQLNQRVSVRYHLKPLNREETQEYVKQRLNIAGAMNNGIFDRAALEAIYRFSKGVPRLVNVISDHSLVSGYASDQRKVTVSLVREALKAVKGEEGLDKPGLGMALSRFAARAGVLVFLGVLVTLFVILGTLYLDEGWAHWLRQALGRLATKI